MKMKLGFAHILTLIFVVFKLIGFIDKWSWWLVFLPVIIVFALAVLMSILEGLIEGRKS